MPNATDYINIAWELEKEASLAPLLGAAAGAAAPPAVLITKMLKALSRGPFNEHYKAKMYGGTVTTTRKRPISAKLKDTGEVLRAIPQAAALTKKDMLVGALLGGGLGLSYDQMRRPDFKEESELR